MIAQLTFDLRDRKHRAVLAFALATFAEDDLAALDAAEAPPPPPRSDVAAGLRESGKEVSRAAAELETVAGKRQKMTPTARAKLAAEKRWGPKRAQKAAAVAKRQIPKDYTKAVEQPPELFPETPSGEEYEPPDGRDIMEGNYPLPNEDV